jgi:hypothetical protein
MQSSPAVEADIPSVERAKLELEREKLAVEKFKAWSGAIAVAAPLLAIAATIGIAVWGQYQKARDDFALKAAEIIMNTDNPDVTYNKARTLAKIFPNHLPPDFAKSFDPGSLSPDEAKSRMELLGLLAAKPEHAKEIVTFWKIMFPDRNWIVEFERQLPPNPVLKETARRQAPP